jgi:hypothetical protein
MLVATLESLDPRRESATTDDRVKDRLGGWQDSEARKQIYQDRQTGELRAQAAQVRREIRLAI